MPNENIKADFILLQPAAHSLGASLSGWSWCDAQAEKTQFPACSRRWKQGPREKGSLGWLRW